MLPQIYGISHSIKIINQNKNNFDNNNIESKIVKNEEIDNKTILSNPISPVNKTDIYINARQTNQLAITELLTQFRSDNISSIEDIEDEPYSESIIENTIEDD